MPALRSLLVVAVVLALSGSVAHASGHSAQTTGTPVASLEPATTDSLWRALVAQQPKPVRAQAACRPLRAVFYAASDWLRLATKLAAAQSPCAEYYVSVPPLVADKTQFRRDQASRIRALGPSFHAMAEIHFTTWSRWVASTGSSWFTAGVTAREHMASAGYDVAQGDTWAVNELSTAVRRGDGNARANIREFVRGLYEGDGSRPTRGDVLIVGFGQRTSDLTAYQSTLQNWFADTAFWTDMATYVSDWSQEVYGDLRAHAVPGEAVADRREYLNDYLQYKLVLANAGPPAIEAARSFLQAAYSPLANAAWPRKTAWGWTMVPVDQMSAYISAQVDAMRFFTATTGQARDHWGFAWAPRNTTGMPADDFATQTGQLLDRLAASIHDSAETIDPETSGTGACGPPGQDSLCLVDIPGATHNAAWQSFRTWTQSALTISAVPTAIPAGTASPPLTLSISLRGERDDAGRGDVALELRAGHVLARSTRTVDGHAHPERLIRGARNLLLPRHARRDPHADGVGDRGHSRYADDLGRGRTGREAGGHSRVGRDPCPRHCGSPRHLDGRVRQPDGHRRALARDAGGTRAR